METVSLPLDEATDEARAKLSPWPGSLTGLLDPLPSRPYIIACMYAYSPTYTYRHDT